MRLAQAVPGQPTWKDQGLEDLRRLPDGEPAPHLLDEAGDAAAAQALLRAVLDIPEGGGRLVHTPTESVRITDASLPHVVEKRADRRERFGNFVLPTLERPTEIWEVSYDDGSARRRYIKLFSGSRYDLLVIVKVLPDGSLFWNLMHRDRHAMNGMRVGSLVYAVYRGA